MTTFTSIPNGDIDPESPITTSLMTAFRDNPIAITEKASGAPVLVDGYVVTAMFAAGALVETKFPSIAVGSTYTYSRFPFNYIVSVAGVSFSSPVTNSTFTVPRAGSYRFTWRMKRQSGSGTVYARTYINDVATGAIKSTASTSYVAQTQDHTLAAGDVIDLRAYVGTGGSNMEIDSWLVTGTAKLFG